MSIVFNFQASCNRCSNFRVLWQIVTFCEFNPINPAYLHHACVLSLILQIFLPKIHKNSNMHICIDINAFIKTKYEIIGKTMFFCGYGRIGEITHSSYDTIGV